MPTSRIARSRASRRAGRKRGTFRRAKIQRSMTRSATTAPAPSRTVASTSPRRCARIPSKMSEVALLDALPVADDLLAAPHRDDDRLHARGGLLAAPHGLDLVVREGRPDHRGGDPRDGDAQRRGLPLEPRLRGADDLVGGGAHVANQGQVGHDALMLERSVAEAPNDEAALSLRGEERDVRHDHPREAPPGETRELLLDRRREPRLGQRGEVVPRDDHLEPRHERVPLGDVPPLQLDSLAAAATRRERRLLLAHQLEGGMDAGARLLRGPLVVDVDRTLGLRGLDPPPRRRLLVDDRVVAVRLDRRGGRRPERISSRQTMRGRGQQPRGPRRDRCDQQQPQRSPAPVTCGEPRGDAHRCRRM